MTITDLLRRRRSIRKFTDRVVTRDDIEALLAAAVLAPNHHLTQPWRFYVLGARARRAYGEALGVRKARKVEAADAAQLVRDKVATEHEALPAMIAIAVVESEGAEQHEEDYAAVMMGVQNIALAAVERGLGTHIKTGAIMADPAARSAVGVAPDERIVAIINVGEPAEVPPVKERTDAGAFTHWTE